MKKIAFLILCLILPVFSFSQQEKNQVAREIESNLFSSFQTPEHHHHPFVSPKKENGKTRINPLFYAGGSLLFIYQNLISEQISAQCNYQITCSSYTLHQIEHFGIIEGSLLGLDQYFNCNPAAKKDFPPYKIRSNHIQNDHE